MEVAQMIKPGDSYVRDKANRGGGCCHERLLIIGIMPGGTFPNRQFLMRIHYVYFMSNGSVHIGYEDRDICDQENWLDPSTKWIALQ